MDIWEYMFKQNSFLKTDLIVISINIFFGAAHYCYTAPLADVVH